MQLKEDQKDIQETEFWVLYGQIPLIVFATYFLLIEIKQMKWGELGEYFSNVWTWIDLAPPLLVFAIIFQMQTDQAPQQTSTFEVILFGTCSFMIWLKVLYFMRIFKQFSYLIRMIIKVIEDMIPFLVVLLFAMVAFADAFYAISLAN